MAETVPELFGERVEAEPGRPALAEPAAGGGDGGSLTWREWRTASRRFAAGLVSAGHEQGDVVAVWADNRLPWPVADVGTLLAGGVSLGLYPSAAPAQVEERLAGAGARFAVVDTGDRLRAVLRASGADREAGGTRGRGGDAAGGAPRVVAPRAAFEDAGVEPGAPAGGERAAAWEDWLQAGGEALGAGDGTARSVDRRARSVDAGDTAVLIYTSGTTGEPKAARLTHRCVLASAASIQEVLGLGPGDSGLSFLPFSHAAERLFGLYTRIRAGMTAGLVPDTSRVWEAARAVRPTLFGAVPRFFEKLHDELRREQEEASGEEAERWERTVELGVRRSRLRRDGEEVPAELDQAWRRVGAPVRERARGKLGGRVRLLTSGGAALPVGVAEHLDALGLTVLGAYGLTEHLCVAFNRPDDYAFETAGPPMPGTEIRIAGDGEILVRRSPLTFSGYLGRPDATAEAFTGDGEWLRTGDLGRLDGRGHLVVEGRKKDVLALSTGKTVSPGPIEEALASDPWVGRAVLFGDGRKFVSALLVPSWPRVEAWADEEGVGGGPEAWARHPGVRERLGEAVDRVNRDLSRSEQVREFVVLGRSLSEEEGELTATGKVRRSRLRERVSDRLEALYG